MAIGFFEASEGNKSISRVLTFIVVIVALIESGVVLYFGKDNIMLAATAAGTIFSTISGPAMIYMYNQKKTEVKQNEGEVL